MLQKWNKWNEGIEIFFHYFNRRLDETLVNIYDFINISKVKFVE